MALKLWSQGAIASKIIISIECLSTFLKFILDFKCILFEHIDELPVLSHTLVT